MAKVKDLTRKVLKVTGKIALLFVLISFGLVLIFKWVPVPITPLMVIRCGEAWLDNREMKLKKEWKSIDEISDHLELAVVASEDQNFLRHPGIDMGAIKKAMEENKTRKKPRGASTISQQTAKNVFLWPGSSYLRKGLEVYFTFLIELIWGKERIMEVYLNVIEMGDGVYGAEEAGKTFFNTPAKKLSREQSALIASVLPNPRKMSCKNPGPYVRKRQGQILKQMRLFGGKLQWEE